MLSKIRVQVTLNEGYYLLCYNLILICESEKRKWFKVLTNVILTLDIGEVFLCVLSHLDWNALYVSPVTKRSIINVRGFILLLLPVFKSIIQGSIHQ